MNYKWRRRLIGAGVLLIAGAIAVSATAVSSAVMATAPKTRYTAPKQTVNVPSLTGIFRVPETRTRVKATQIPVLAYHAMNDRCAAFTLTCKSPDYESVSTLQFTDEMQWLYDNGFHTVTMTQYVAWLHDRNTLLPPKPFLIIDDNGDSDFLLGAEPILYHFRYTVTAVIVTGFTDAATTGYCGPEMKVHGRMYDMQRNCGGPNTWNITWPQLKALSPQVYNYALEAGADGHFVQEYNSKCPMYYTCMIPGETSGEYEMRVIRDIQNGLTELSSELPGRVSTNVWTVPYSDLGYTCKNNQCPEEISNSPANWLVSLAAVHFAAVFVQTPSRNGIEHERFRYEIHNSTTLRQFRQAIGVYLREGAWK